MSINRALPLILLITFTLALPAVAADRTFRWFDATQYTHKPDLAPLGFEKLNVIYGHFLWPNQKITDDVPRQDFLEARLREFGAFDGSAWCIDIEHWAMNGTDAEAWVSADKLLSVLAAARRVNPNGQIGFYGEVPLNSYYPAIAEKTSEKYRKWVSDNLRNRRVANAVDVVFPSIYTFYNTPEEWVTYAVRQIEMARAYGKPVYAFIWPQYHDSNEIHPFASIDRRFWRLQLETVYQHADGVVIWGGWDFHKNRKARWDEQAEWWQETREFIRVKNSVPPSIPDNLKSQPGQ